MLNNFYLFDTLARVKKNVVPLNAKHLTLYACGITVYDDCHLGHARSMIAFDVLVRYLRAHGQKVLFVRNITDIDDKIIQRAISLGCDIEELTNKYINSMHNDMHNLGVLVPDVEPKATHHIPSIIKFIDSLIKKNYAYQTISGDICFSVTKFNTYGKLSQQNLVSLQAGTRITIDKDKHNPLDFVLWKMAKPGEPFWDSPWGRGRPGWHIECSAMVLDCLGETIDIHGGGVDLCFPHHENEIAQSEAFTSQKLANIWMHVGMLQLNNEKMSKSTGNFLTIKQVLEKYHPDVLRYFLLSGHYRSILNYSLDTMEMVQKSMNRLYQACKNVPLTHEKLNLEELELTWVKDFFAAMNDDLNTPAALAVLFSLSHEINRSKNDKLAILLRKLAAMLGLLQHEAASYFTYGMSAEKLQYISKLINDRTQARHSKNWQVADKIREELSTMGIEVADSLNGTTWFLQ